MNEVDEHVLAVNRLHFWQYGNHATNFTSQLFDLMMKADGHNQIRLAIAFPLEFTVWREWYTSENPDDFFKKYGLPCNGIGYDPS